MNLGGLTMNSDFWTSPLSERDFDSLREALSDMRGIRSWSPYYPNAVRMGSDLEMEISKRKVCKCKCCELFGPDISLFNKCRKFPKLVDKLDN